MQQFSFQRQWPQTAVLHFPLFALDFLLLYLKVSTTKKEYETNPRKVFQTQTSCLVSKM